MSKSKPKPMSKSKLPDLEPEIPSVPGPSVSPKLPDPEPSIPVKSKSMTKSKLIDPELDILNVPGPSGVPTGKLTLRSTKKIKLVRLEFEIKLGPLLLSCAAATAAAATPLLF